MMKKRFLSLLLAMLMVVSLVPMTVFATGTSYAITNGTPESAKETNHGYISIDKETAAEGETVTIAADPAEGGTFRDDHYNTVTTIEGVPEGTSYEIYEDIFYLAYNPDNAYSDILITPVANEGYHFDHWEVVPQSGKVTSDLTVKAVFAKDAIYTVTVTANPTEGGTISDFAATAPTFTVDVVSGTEYSVNRDGLFTLYNAAESHFINKYYEAIANEGYQFTGWKVNGETAGSGTVTDHITVTAEFEKAAPEKPEAPAEGEGCGIDYAREVISVEEGYEISKSADPFVAEVPDENGELPLEYGTTYYVRKAAAGDVPASDATSFTTKEFEKTPFFVDVKEKDWFFDSVQWAAMNGITTGTDETHFSPMLPVTRAQVVTFLWRAAGCPVVDYAMNMTDVKAGAYYAEAVRWALAEGVTKGTSSTTFAPDKECSRAEVVTFLARFAGTEDENTESGFEDVKATAYYAAAVKWAKDNNVTTGVTETEFAPTKECTRAEIVTFLYRWMTKH